MKQSLLNNLAFNSSIVFSLLFFLSVIKPFSLPNSNRYLGALLFLFIIILFTYSVLKKANYQLIFKNYSDELLFLLLYLGTSFFSLMTHINEFDHFSHFIFFSLASLVVFISSFMLWFIFSLNKKNEYRVIIWILVLLMALLALWQYLDYSGSRIITDYFVSADSAKVSAEVINSVTRWHTVYGAMVAIAILALLPGLANAQNKTALVLKLLLIFFLLFVGIIGESRNFLFSLGIGLIILLGSQFRNYPKTVMMALLSTIVLVHLLLINNTRALNDYAQIFPYLKKIEQKQIPQASDFIPQINNQTLTDRATLWQQGFELWKKQPWLGVGPGMYRTINSQDIQQRNLHNFYFQVLVETGALGFMALMGLILLLIKNSIKAGNFFIFGAILASLLFDNYLDYSFPWVIMMVWFLSISILMNKTGKES